MGSTTALNLPQPEALHVDVMRAIAQDLHDLPMVLKGGTALLLCYGLDRFSEDLDFDAPKKFGITTRIERVVCRFTPEFDIKTVKDTATVQRLKLHYRVNAVDRLLKIETSLRPSAAPGDAWVKDGIHTYKINAIIDQKIAALLGRTKARDLYDVTFLARQYRGHFSTQAIENLTRLVADIDALEARFHMAFEDDSILRIEQLAALLLQLSDSISQ